MKRDFMNSQKIKQKVQQLFDKQAKNLSSLEELNQWYRSLDEQTELPENSAQLQEEVWFGKVLKEIWPSGSITPPAKSTRIRQWIWRAAILLIFCGAGFGLFQVIPKSPESTPLEAGIYSNEIGKVSVFSLPDGSKVWLSTGSTLEYAANFPQNREVSLTGEAFFDVARNSEHPFKIRTGNMITEVLGTSFNLRSYEKSQVELSVYSGRVKFSNQLADADAVMLFKGESVSWKEGEGISEVVRFDPSKLPEWRQGKISFENASLEEISTALERWYKVTIQLDGNGRNCHYSGEFTQASLEQILETLSYTLNLTYRINNAYVKIRANPCE